jgi:hypothetical protein
MKTKKLFVNLSNVPLESIHQNLSFNKDFLNSPQMSLVSITLN